MEDEFRISGDSISLDCKDVNAGKLKSGWTITGEELEDYYCFCYEFKATHPLFGVVGSDDLNEDESIYASSVSALIHFWLHHGKNLQVMNEGDV